MSGSAETALTFVVRQRITHPRHLDRFNAWHRERGEELARSTPISGVRRYSFDKDRLFFYTFYDLRPGTSWDDGARGAARRIREVWCDFGPDMRELTAVPYERIWSRAKDSTDLAAHPITIERLAFSPLFPEREREWASWLDEDMLPERLARLPLASISRWRALEGEPRYYIHLHEYEDEQRMRDSIAASEKPGADYGAASSSKFWAGWATYMPYVDDLTRWIILPDAVAAKS